MNLAHGNSQRRAEKYSKSEIVFLSEDSEHRDNSMLIPVEVHRNHDLGVFTSTDIKKDTKVWSLNSEEAVILTWKEEHMKFYRTQTKEAILYHLAHAWWYDSEESVVQNDMSDLINHSEDPNLEYRDDLGALWATRDIPSGTELTYDYSKRFIWGAALVLF